MTDIPESVAAEFSAAEQEERVVAPVLGVDIEPTEVHSPDDWKPEVSLILSIVQGAAPGWNWPPEQLDIMAEGLREVLHRLAPGGLGNLDAWGPWAKVAVGAGMIAMANFDWQEHKFRPRIAHEERRDTDSSGGGKPSREDVERDAGYDKIFTAAGMGSEGELGDSPVPSGSGAG